MNNTDYIYDDIVDAIKRVGVVKDDVLFSHSNIGMERDGKPIMSNIQ